MYGGQCSGYFTKSMVELITIAKGHEIPVTTHFLFNESLIQRARNYVVDEFLRSECTHLMFIDSDIGFDARDVMMLAALASDESRYDVIAGPYPKKVIAWEKIKQAVDRGVADVEPRNLERFVGDFAFNPVPEIEKFRVDEPVEVMEAGTGFMMIKRSTFERFAEKYPELSYVPDHQRSDHFDGQREIHLYFDSVIDDDERRYLSEDYHFCKMVRAAGMGVYLCPWMKLQHVGHYVFGGDLGSLASIRANPTVNPEEIGKEKPKKRTWTR